MHQLAIHCANKVIFRRTYNQIHVLTHLTVKFPQRCFASIIVFAYPDVSTGGRGTSMDPN